MAEDARADTDPAADDESLTSSVDEHEVHDDLVKLAYAAMACAGAIALVAFLHWRFTRIEARIARRHPLLTEVLEELVDPEWHVH